MTWSKWREWFQWRQACSLSASLLRCIRESVSRISYIATRKICIELFLVSRRIANSTVEFVWAMCACADVCRHPRYPGKCQSTVVKRWIVARARACVRTRDPVLASRMWIFPCPSIWQSSSLLLLPLFRKWYLKPFAKTSPTGLSPYRRDYIAYASISLFSLLFSSFMPFTGWRENKHREECKACMKETIALLFMKLRNYWESM